MVFQDADSQAESSVQLASQVLRALQVGPAHWARVGEGSEPPASCGGRTVCSKQIVEELVTALAGSNEYVFLSLVCTSAIPWLCNLAMDLLSCMYLRSPTLA